jgi:DNA polymerase-3 subunit alpha
MFLIFDTETTGLAQDWTKDYKHVDNWPRCVQIAWQLHDDEGKLIEAKDYLIKPVDFDIPFDAERVHGISTLLAQKQGEELTDVLDEFNAALKKSKFIVGQNLRFDINVMGAEFLRAGLNTPMHDLPVLDTCTEATANICQLSGGRGNKFKLPNLTELHQHLFQVPFNEAHNATADVEATTRCFLELVRRALVEPLGFIPTPRNKSEEVEPFSEEIIALAKQSFQKVAKFYTSPIPTFGLIHKNLKQESERLKELYGEEEQQISKKDLQEGLAILEDTDFVHLHNHSQFSVLQSTIDIKGLIKKAAEFNMPAVALTDTGNMMAAFHFEKHISSHNKQIREEKKAAEEKGEPFHKKEILPIIGCEFHVCEDHLNKTVKDNGYQIVFLAKNRNGYHNLAKMSSIAFTAGKYYVPRIDKKIVEQYKEDLIVLSGNLYGEIPSKILNIGEKQAEEALIWWKEQFGDDFYLELMRHGQADEDRVNATLLEFSKKHNIKIVATNNTFYLNQSDAIVHDILLCIKDGEMVNTPKGRGRGFRYGLDNEEYYFKSPQEMKQLFADVPEAISNTLEIVEKCEHYGLARDVLLPAFDIPEEFQDPQDQIDGGKRGENNYLRHLTYEGAKQRYNEITDEIRERLDFELEIIAKTGYPGYFLIVQDFCQAAREMGVVVGPGRGSAAGSAVAYCTGITNIDPIAYDLLFERFLNPDRVSMPDIDIDFDDEGRGRIIDWVIEKYGANQVAQIITYGTMAAKSSVRDTARVLNLPLFEADRLAKLIPDISLSKLFQLDEVALAEKLKNNQENIAAVNELKKIANGQDLAAEVVQKARKIEGTVRNTGIHACGVIITPGDITNYVPVATAKDTDMYCTQYDNSVVEEAGLLKMDFLGLKTLTLIKDAVKFVELRTGKKLIPDEFPLDDLKTYELFQRGETVGVFQYESPGMQKYMRELKPTVFADLIAMNALYRPGPLEYIPSFIRRKHGEEKIEYDIPAAAEYLEETYGITVYQEQVMLLSQKLGGFTKGEADTLRKAMGKKKLDLLAQLKPKFLAQGKERGHDVQKLEKMWRDWEAFASYAFNKSHSTCYAWIAYQTAYLKANHPAEYMASVLSNNMNDIKQVTFFMEECKRMGIPVLGPDINESDFKFTVNPEGAIRFGLGAIKGVGSGPVEAIVAERANGHFKDIFDLTKRVNLKQINKRVVESLALAGAFDSFQNMHRAQYFHEDGGKLFLEVAIKYGINFQENENSSQISIFEVSDHQEEMPVPNIPVVSEWSSLQKLNKEKEVVGIYISGHPLDDYALDIQSFCNATVEELKQMEPSSGKELIIPAIITSCEHRHTRKGDPFGTITIEDYTDSMKLFFFQQDYGKYRTFMAEGAFVYISGKYQPKRFNDKEFEFKVLRMDFLSNLRSSRTKGLRIDLELSEVNFRTIEDIDKIFESHKGDYPVTFKIHDHLNGLEIDMPSSYVKIDISDECIKQLKNKSFKYSLI